MKTKERSCEREEKKVHGNGNEIIDDKSFENCLNVSKLFVFNVAIAVEHFPRKILLSSHDDDKTVSVFHFKTEKAQSEKCFIFLF